MRAEREDRPVFVSIGYSTCHWCHVMAHESAEDPEVAELLNAGFVCIKVDREERRTWTQCIWPPARPQLTRLRGWPLTVCMDAKQVPFFAGPTFPRGPVWAMGPYGAAGAGAAALAQTGSGCWPPAEKVARRSARPGGRRSAGKGALQEAYRWLRRSFIPNGADLGPVPNFPNPNLLFLMQFYRLEQKQKALDMAESTLDAMARGGIQDQIGGGFSRYSTDESG